MSIINQPPEIPYLLSKSNSLMLFTFNKKQDWTGYIMRPNLTQLNFPDTNTVNHFNESLHDK